VPYYSVVKTGGGGIMGAIGGIIPIIFDEKWTLDKCYPFDLKDRHKNTSSKAFVMAHAYSNVIIDKIEEEQKIDYIINATRALCWDNINYNQYFRICLAIEKTFIDDLLFIKKNYDKNTCLPGTIEAVSLTLNGLMYQYINVAPTLAQIANPSEINDNAPKTHRFTELGSWVYNMALNYEKDKYLK
jgi:hypothetical protein